jgi:hypothetical protein
VFTASLQFFHCPVVDHYNPIKKSLGCIHSSGCITFLNWTCWSFLYIILYIYNYNRGRTNQTNQTHANFNEEPLIYWLWSATRDFFHLPSWECGEISSWFLHDSDPEFPKTPRSQIRILHWWLDHSVPNPGWNPIKLLRNLFGRKKDLISSKSPGWSSLFPLVMTNSSPWYRWPIEIDVFPS